MNGLSVALVNAGFFYPIYWISMFVVRAAPALLHVAFLGHRLLGFQFGPLWINAVCSPPGAFAAQSERSESATLEALLVVASAGAVILLMRQRRVFAGLLLASLGQVALMDSLFRVVFGSRRPPALLATATLYAAVLLVGLALMASSTGCGYFRRWAAPLIGFCLPLALFSSFYLRFGAAWQEVGTVVAPALVLSTLAAVWNRPTNSVEVGRAVTLLRFATGLTASLLLAGVIHAAEAVRDRSHVKAHQAFLDAIPKAAASTAYPKIFFQKGVNFTAEGPIGYDPQGVIPLLDLLKDYGVNSIALVPYGFGSSKEPDIRYPGGMESSEDIEAITALAHQRGIKVLLKPQLWTRGGFPGNIGFPAPAERARWFTAYRKFLEYYATLAAKIHADLLSVGVELGKMTPYESEWRALIARARELYPGPLVYSATQGPEFETIRFWDALDYIGLNEYYPLPDDLATADLVQKVAAIHEKFARPVIFTEAGFPSFEKPNRAPWDETPRTVTPADQARCYEAVLKAFYTQPWFQGMYWWKVGTNGFGGPEDGSHTPWGKPAMDVVKRWYVHGKR